MATQVLMPKMGLTMTEGTIEEWKKKEGESVSKGEALFSVSTDKLTNDVEADTDGVLLKVLFKEGDTVPCKTAVAWIGQPGEKISEMPGKEAEPKPNEKTAEKGEKTAKNIVVVGAGPGGYVAAIRAAQMGANVTVIEAEKVGGTCLNRGCIPTKCLLHSAELLNEIREKGKELGVKADNIAVDFPQVIAHKASITKQLTDGVTGLFRVNKIKRETGTASFSGTGQLQLCKPDGVIMPVEADAVILATGSMNSRPPIPGMWENENCIDSSDALSLTELPKSMIVVGGGVIGLELACAYASFGTKITVVEALDRMLPMLDREIADIGIENVKKLGVTFHTQSPVQCVEQSPVGAKVICVNSAGEEFALEAEKVLVAIGRKPNTAALQLDVGGIKNNKGRIQVNERMQTSVPNVYAVGDCVDGYAQLAHTASVMGEIAAENIMGHPSAYDEKTNPTCVYLLPEAASVGLSEEACKAQGIDYLVGRFPMSGNGKALILNGGNGLVKIIADKKYKEVLGMHIIGPHATDLIAEGAMAIRLEATLDEVISTIHSHPTVTESIREAALHVEKRAIHTVNR